MDHTLMYVRGGPDVDKRAYGYSEQDGSWTRTDQSVTSATRGDGGIYSSVDDLAKWDAAPYDDRLPSAASRKLAFRPHVKVTGEPYEASYGYGWRSAERRVGQECVSTGRYRVSQSHYKKHKASPKATKET